MQIKSSSKCWLHSGPVRAFVPLPYVRTLAPRNDCILLQCRWDLSSDNSDDDDFILQWAQSNTPAKQSDVMTSSPNSQRQNKIENETIAVKHEVEVYICDASANGDITDPLLWWRDKRKQYPWVSFAARKWLSVYSTSTPSERVVSICGIVNSAKRSRYWCRQSVLNASSSTA